MYYKGYPISSVEAELLYDILQTQQEILAELKKQNESTDTTVNEPILSEEETESVDKANEQIEALAAEQEEILIKEIVEVKTEQPKQTKKPVRRPTKKQAKKKSKG